MDSDGPPPVNDAEADFLAREKDEMAEFGDDFGFSSENPPPIDETKENPFGDPMPTESLNKLSMDESPELPMESTDFEHLEAPLDEVPPPVDITDEFPEDPLEEKNELDFDPMAQFQEQPTPDDEEESFGYDAIKVADVQHAEPEKIKRWREEQKERIEKKDKECERKSLEWKETAKKELDDWYKHNSEQVEKTKANNVIAEEDFIKERDDTAPGHEWQRICRLCDFSGAQSSKGSVKTMKDVSRMRSILLQLKQTPLVRT